MPNIFPLLQQPQVGAMVTPSDPVPMPSVLGTVGAPSGASLALNAADNDVQALQNKYSGDAPKQYDYSAHSVLGNIGHVLARTANIAGDILDPAATELIPNSDLYNAHKRAGDLAELQSAQERQMQAQRESDVLGNEEANREAEQPGRDATLAKTEQETKDMQTPALQHIVSDQGIFALNPRTGELKPLTYNGQPLTQPTKTTRPNTPEQQYLDEYAKLHPGSTVAEAERHYKLDTTVQNPPQVLMFTPGPNGTSTAQLVKPGSTVAPGAQTAPGLNSSNTPTNMQRNAAGRADLVLQSIPDVLHDLHTNAAQLGPGMGRFNDIYTGKIGAPNPEFAGLMADLHLMGTAVALAHAQGRMSNELLNEFNSMIAAPQQSPQNIEATLNKVQNFMQRAANQGKPATSSAPGAPPAGAKIIDFTQLSK